MVKIGKPHRIPQQVLEGALLRPKDASEGDVSFEKLDGARSRIIFPTRYGNATFEKINTEEVYLIRWRITPDGVPEQTEEHPVSVQIFNSAEELCLQYIESQEGSERS